MRRADQDRAPDGRRQPVGFTVFVSLATIAAVVCLAVAATRHGTRGYGFLRWGDVGIAFGCLAAAGRFVWKSRTCRGLFWKIMLVAFSALTLAAIGSFPVPGWEINYPGATTATATANLIHGPGSADGAGPEIRKVGVGLSPWMPAVWLAVHGRQGVQIDRVHGDAENDPAVVRDTIKVQALAAAYRTAGRPVRLTGGVLRIRTANPDTGLAVGDKLVDIDGIAVHSDEEYYAAIAIATAPATVTVGVLHNGARRTVTATVATYTSRDGIGLRALTGPAWRGVTVELVEPMRSDDLAGTDITIDPDESGDSAGLAYALGLLHRLGRLPGPDSARIVVTGAITADGTIIPIGAADIKAVSARHSHACLMIVPTPNVTAAERTAGTMPVTGVDTLADAIAAVRDGCPPNTTPS